MHCVYTSFSLFLSVCLSLPLSFTVSHPLRGFQLYNESIVSSYTFHRTVNGILSPARCPVLFATYGTSSPNISRHLRPTLQLVHTLRDISSHPFRTCMSVLTLLSMFLEMLLLYSFLLRIPAPVKLLHVSATVTSLAL